MTIVALFLTSSAFANVINSQYADSFNKAISSNIAKECGEMEDLTLTSAIETEDHVDQGITDTNYALELTGKQLYDQNIYDTYKISVKASYLDGYDHRTQEDGSYLIDSIECKMQ